MRDFEWLGVSFGDFRIMPIAVTGMGLLKFDSVTGS